MNFSPDYFLNQSIPEPNSGCWLWAGAIAATGYGVVAVNGKNKRAHRLSYEAANNALLPSTVVVCHRCDTPSCVNPEHLFAGSQADNVRDCLLKDRRRGAPPRDGFSRITPEAVIAIRASSLTKDELAAMYGINRRNIQKIRNRKSWSHIP